MFAKKTRNYDLAMQDPLFGPAAFQWSLNPNSEIESDSPGEG
jgi:hypothetical protein